MQAYVSMEKYNIKRLNKEGFSIVEYESSPALGKTKTPENTSLI